MMGISEALRRAMESSGKTRYAISRDTGIPESTLSRFAAGHYLRGENMDKLCAYLGLVLVTKAARAGKER